MQLSLEDFQLNDQVYFPKNYRELATDKVKQAWEIAAQTWVEEGYAIEKPRGICEALPVGKHFDSILDIGCGYGRYALYLNQDKNITFNHYYGIDISENMLRRFLKSKETYNFLPSTNFHLICMSAADKLPCQDNSIDLVLSSSVFIHMDKQQVNNAVAEVARVLKPGGIFIFEDSFFNQLCPAHFIRNSLRRLIPNGENPAYFKRYSLSEIHSLLKDSQILNKTPNYTILPLKHEIFPEKLRGIKIPLATEINQINLPRALREVLASSYTVYSNNLSL